MNMITEFIKTGKINGLKVGEFLPNNLTGLLETSEKHANSQPLGYQITINNFWVDVYVKEDRMIENIVCQIHPENKEFGFLIDRNEIKIKELDIKNIIRLINQYNLEWEFVKVFAHNAIGIRVLTSNVDIILQYEHLEHIELSHIKAF